ncbi:MAG: hypothetical protein R3272_06515 [Candidatus Promineifilaceae bacterium]|nr:hypothetical protein [Candidatus Promineifilaceae bacterium]
MGRGTGADTDEWQKCCALEQAVALAWACDAAACGEEPRHAAGPRAPTPAGDAIPAWTGIFFQSCRHGNREVYAQGGTLAAVSETVAVPAEMVLPTLSLLSRSGVDEAALSRAASNGAGGDGQASPTGVLLVVVTPGGKRQAGAVSPAAARSVVYEATAVNACVLVDKLTLIGQRLFLPAMLRRRSA